MKKEYWIITLFVLFVWASRDKIPPQFQFWKTTHTMITVRNNSDQNLSDVTLVVWSEPHPLGAIAKDSAKNLNAPRLRDTTDVIVKFKYGGETVERLVGTLDEDSDYKMNIQVNFAGVVTAQVGAASAESR